MADEAEPKTMEEETKEAPPKEEEEEPKAEPPKEEEEKEEKEEEPKEEEESKEEDADADEDKKRTAPPPTEEGRPKREKRARKSAEAFVPEDFTNVDRHAMIKQGRGKKLGEIKAVRDSVETYQPSSEEMQQAHKLLYPTKGGLKPIKKEMKTNIFAFSGYLEKKKEGQDEKELEQQDEEAEAKISGKVYKLTVPQIKRLCDFFSLDRSGIHDKDALVNLLLDFLGQPDEKFVKGSKSKSSSGKSKASKKTATKAEEYDDLDEEEDDNQPLKKGGMPSDEQLRKWVRAYVRCFNMEKATIKDALEIAGEKFDVDLSEKKAVLKKLLTEEM